MVLIIPIRSLSNVLPVNINNRDSHLGLSAILKSSHTNIFEFKTQEDLYRAVDISLFLSSSLKTTSEIGVLSSLQNQTISKK